MSYALQLQTIKSAPSTGIVIEFSQQTLKSDSLSCDIVHSSFTHTESDRMDTSYYHVTDPLENFNLKVIVRESSRTTTGKDLLIDGAHFYEETKISWQEKRDGPGDIVKNRLKSVQTAQVIPRSFILCHG